MCVYTAADRWLYDVNSMQWRDLGMTDDDPPRLWHTATPYDDGEVIIFGGCHGDILSHHEMPVCWLTSVTCVLFRSHTFPGRGQIDVVSTLDDGLRPRSHWCESESEYRVSLHGLAKVTLHCKQCYVTWTLYYVRHNNDVNIDVKTFWRPFFAVSWRKKRNCTQKMLVFQGNLYSYTEPVLLWTAAIGIHAHSCLLKPVHDYLDSFLYQWEHSLIHGSLCCLLAVSEQKYHFDSTVIIDWQYTRKMICSWQIIEHNSSVLVTLNNNNISQTQYALGPLYREGFQLRSHIMPQCGATA